MSEEFINLLKELFPSIEEGTQVQLKAFIRQYQDNPKLFYGTKRGEKIHQGDIISKVPFLIIKENGKVGQGILNGMVISHSCDIEHNDEILIVPVYGMELFMEECTNNPDYIANLKKNIIYDKFYLPPFSNEKECMADLSGVTSYEAGYIHSGLRNKNIKILKSLSQTGYHFFICKLTVHFLRREQPEEACRETL